MNASPVSGFLAVDVGSSRVKLGWFPSSSECTSDKQSNKLPITTPQLRQPSETLAVSHANPTLLWTQIGAWLQEFCPAGPPAAIASVHPEALASVQEMFAYRLQVLLANDLPLELRVEHPERVGIDRLLSAVAANRLRLPGRPALVVDLGTACTVDLIASDGAFEGGAIFPGVTLSAEALHTGTATLPQWEAESSGNWPAPVGKSTQAAIASGLYWGTIGAVRELVDRISQGCDPAPQLFFTGGGAPQLIAHFADDQGSIRHIPHLVLAGIAIAVDHLRTDKLVTAQPQVNHPSAEQQQ